MNNCTVKNRGFSLVEILLVVVLLAILAMVVIPIYWDYQNEARTARAERDISILNRQLELYNANEARQFPQRSLPYRRAAKLMARAGYIKDINEAPEGFRYTFDGNAGKFTYAQVEN
ncbi:MAG: prepilin-type N-terminal cleavage/methylation domain-containing protein [Phycisphaerae bacterium]|nr:prepilin-type N-terminal cleavage/methylation domain-containing protein [Phycisphaerae bacterium]